MAARRSTARAPGLLRALCNADRAGALDPVNEMRESTRVTDAAAYVSLPPGMFDDDLRM
jgi:hypothetical protein